MLCISDFSTAIHCKCDCNQYQVVFDGKVMSQGGLMCSEAYVNVKITTGFGRPIGVQNRIPFNALIHIWRVYVPVDIASSSLLQVCWVAARGPSWCLRVEMEEWKEVINNHLSLPRSWIEIFFSFFMVLEFELRTYILSHSTSRFLVMGFFKVGSHELFALVGFESWFSWSLPSEKIGLQCKPSAWNFSFNAKNQTQDLG
jgi:hypothetical protein